ncbi:MAG: DUF3263 domain-containing protein [Actinobacteria bacterium]|nr:DUF3263 domain-containing protein [Actinomycetota bacterium]
MSMMENANTSQGALSELEVRILEFEGTWWKFAGAKESAIKELFDLSAPRYYQLLNDLIDREDALIAAPMLVKRLRRLREAHYLRSTKAWQSRLLLTKKLVVG